jgi:hypothetical protein
MATKIVTSLNKDLWDRYAKETFATWADNLRLGAGSEIEVWIWGPFPKGLPTKTANGTPFKYKLLDTQSEGWTYFIKTFGNHSRPESEDGQAYKHNFVPFSCKVYATAEAAWALRQQEGPKSFQQLVWLDADVLAKATVGEEDIKGWLGNANLAWLDRAAPWGHGETGFIVSDTTDNSLDLFLNQANMYGSGQLFYFNEWHDAFVLTSLIRLKTFTDAADFVVRNLNTDLTNSHKDGLQPFETSPLSTKFVHFKGMQKDNINNVKS